PPSWRPRSDPSALGFHNVPAVAGIPALTGHDAMWAMLGGEIVNRANEPSLNLNANAGLASASDRALALHGALDVSNPSERRESLMSVAIDGAGADPSADALLDGALTVEGSQTSSAAMDAFYALLAEQSVSAE